MTSPSVDSPDPLVLSRISTETGSPVKLSGQPTTPSRVTSPTKTNVRLQDFYLKTPPTAPSFVSSPTRSSTRRESVISPWKIRVTVDAERDERIPSILELDSPSRRLTNRTVTTRVPLRGGDDSSASPSKRSRGRLRKSLNSPTKRPATPKPGATRKRRTMAEILGEVGENGEGSVAAARKRGRPRRSPKVSEKGTWNDQTPQEAFARPRSRGRRKAITPMKISTDQTAGTGDPVPPENPLHDRALKGKSGNASPPKTNVSSGQDFVIYSDSQGYKIPSLKSISGMKNSASTRREVEVATPEASEQESVLERRDEAMWRSMLRPSFRSPRPTQISPSLEDTVQPTDLEQEEAPAVPATDPTHEHHEFDSIMESEGFSMISASSLPSAGQRSQGSAEVSRVSGTAPVQAHTPVNATTDESMPPPPLPPKIPESERPLNTTGDGTPRLMRVVRAGNALNGAIEPPEVGICPPAENPQNKRISNGNTSQSVSDDVFGGFGAVTRRELRAGLRLGEELAKRYSTDVQGSNGSSGKTSKSVDGSRDLLPKSPTSQNRPEPEYSSQQKQLPSPEDSEVMDDGQMSWKVISPAKPSSPLGSQQSSPDCSCHSHHYPVEDTMMREQDEKWQREREAVSRQIDMANASQVIVINSDDEDEVNEDQEEDNFDVWQEEANSSNVRVSEAQDSIHPFAGVSVRPPRSKLPSPWRRNTELLYSDELTAVLDNSSPTHRRVDSEAAGLQDDAISEHSRLIKQESTQDSLMQLSRMPEEAQQPQPAPESPHRGESHSTLEDHAQISLQDGQSLGDQEQSFVPYPSPEESSSSSSSLSLDVKASTYVGATAEEPPHTSNRLVISRTIVESSRRSLFGDGGEPATKKPKRILSSEQKRPQKHALEPRSPPQVARKVSRGSRAGIARSGNTKTTIAPAARQTSTFLGRLSSAVPIFSLRIPFTSSSPQPLPSSSTDSGPLPSTPLYSHHPWTPAHFAYLYPYYAAARRDPKAYPFDPRSPYASLVCQVMRNQCGWSKPCEAWEIGVVDRFLALLRKYGRKRDQSLDDIPHLQKETGADERTIDGQDVTVKLFQLWVGGVVRGECAVGIGTTGEVLEGERAGEKWEWPRDRWVDENRKGKKYVEWGMVER